MRKLLIAVFVLAVVGVGGYFGVNAYAQKEAEQQIGTLFGNLEAGGLKATHGPVGFDLFGRRLDIAGIDLVAPDGGGTTSIGRVKATGLSLPSNGRMKVGRIEIADIAFDGPNPVSVAVKASYRIPLIVIEDYEGPESFSASTSEPWQLLLSFLEAASAREVSAPSVSATTQAGEGDTASSTSVAYGAMRLSGIAGGKIATMQIEPSTFTIKTTAVAGGSATGEIGRMSAKGMDIGATIALGDAGRRAAGTTFRTLYESIEADGYKAKFDNGLTQDWKKITVGKVAVRPAALPVDQLRASLRQLDELETKGEKATPAENAALFEAMAGAYGAFELGDISIEDMALQMPDKADVSMKAMRIGAMKGGRFEAFTIDGLSVKGQGEGSFKLDHFALNGLNAQELMQLCADAVSDPAVVNKPQTALAAFRLLAGIDVAGLEAQAADAPDELTRIENFQFNWSDFAGPIPQKIASSVRMSAPTEKLAEKEPVFSMLADAGLPRIDLAFDGAINLNAADKTLTANPSLRIADAFSATYNISLAGIDPAFFQAQSAAEVADKLLAVNFAGLEVTLTDAGIYQMQMKRMADEQGATPEATQEMVVGFAQIIGEQIATDHPELEPATKAVLDFLSAPKGKLTIRITPKNTLPIVALLQAANGGDPAAALDLVNIEATSSR